MPPASSPQAPATRVSRPHAARIGRYVALALYGCFLAYAAYWLSASIRYDDLLIEFARIPPRAVLVAMAMNVFVLTFYGLRLAAIMGVEAFPCFVIANIGFTFNSLVPFRLGEGVKAYVGATQFGFPLGALGVAIVLEKIYDLSALAILTTLAGATTHSALVAPDVRPILAAPFLVALLGFLVLRARGSKEGGPLSETALAGTPRLNRFIAQAASLFATQDVRRPALMTASIWTMNVCLVLVLFRTILPEIDFGLSDAMTLLVIAALAIAIPASPAGLGVFEAGVAAFLINFHGVAKESAVAAALALHLVITVPHSIFALLFVAAFCLRALRGQADM